MSLSHMLHGTYPKKNIYIHVPPNHTGHTHTERFTVGRAHLKLRASWSPSFSLAPSGSPGLHSWGLPERPRPRGVHPDPQGSWGAWRGRAEHTGLPVPTCRFLSRLWPVCTLMSHLICTPLALLGAPSQTP